ncbi:MAG: molybdenum cofactor biosynthesis protein B [Lachnotalea sp.]
MLQNKQQFRVAVITSSDKGYSKERIDTSGPTIIEMVQNHNYIVTDYVILPDEQELLSSKMKQLADENKCDLILTTGGTGCSPRDVTPEATKEIIDKEVPGIAEAIRSYSMTITKRAMLGRGIAGIRKKTLIVNLPGSQKAVSESLTYIIDTLEHGLTVLKGDSKDCGRS